MTNKEKFLQLVSNEKTDTLKKIEERIKNRAQLRESRAIAYKVLDRLDELGWSQKDLAEKMEVTPQHINKIVRGQENLTISTMLKLQEILTIPLLASFYEQAMEKFVELIQNAIQEPYKVSEEMKEVEYTQDAPVKTVKLEYTKQNGYSYFELSA